MPPPPKSSMNRVLMHMIQPNYQQTFLPGISGAALNLPTSPAVATYSFVKSQRSRQLNAANQMYCSSSRTLVDSEMDHRDFSLVDEESGNATPSNLNTRESQLRDQIKQLKQEIIKLKTTLSSNEIEMDQLNEQLKNTIAERDKYKPLYEEECLLHANTLSKLKFMKEMLSSKEDEMKQTFELHQRQTQEMMQFHQRSLDEAIKSKEEIIQEKNIRIDRLKFQLKEAFQGSSMERQNQLQQLVKQLDQTRDEADRLRKCLEKSKAKDKEATQLLRIRSSAYQPGIPEKDENCNHDEYEKDELPCSNCKRQRLLIQDVKIALTEKQETLDRLTIVCSQLEERLRRQKTIVQAYKGSGPRPPR